MVLCGHRKLKSKKSRLGEQSRRDACSVLCAGITAQLLPGCRSDLHSTSSETGPENNPFLSPQWELRSSKLQKSYWNERQWHQMCSGEWGPTALQEHIRKQKFVNCGSVWMQQHSSSLPPPPPGCPDWCWSGWRRGGFSFN